MRRSYCLECSRFAPVVQSGIYLIFGFRCHAIARLSALALPRVATSRSAGGLRADNLMRFHTCAVPAGPLSAIPAQRRIPTGLGSLSVLPGTSFNCLEPAYSADCT